MVADRVTSGTWHKCPCCSNRVVEAPPVYRVGARRTAPARQVRAEAACCLSRHTARAARRPTRLQTAHAAAAWSDASLAVSRALCPGCLCAVSPAFRLQAVSQCESMSAWAAALSRALGAAPGAAGQAPGATATTAQLVARLCAEAAPGAAAATDLAGAARHDW